MINLLFLKVILAFDSISFILGDEILALVFFVGSFKNISEINANSTENIDM
ncbi:hypothetical protein D3C71_2189900 [compost metagenome]